MLEIIFPGWLAGIVIALTTSPLGSLIVWRRMSSFGDTLSHSSFLALSISIILDINSFYIVFLFISLLAFILAWLEELLPVSIETILSIISHSSLSFGIVFISLMSTDDKQIDITHYLFGDLLSVTSSDLTIIFIGSMIILSVLIYHWNAILSATINEELAQIDGVNIFYARLTIMLMTALTISMAIKFVGSLLVTSLLIIPPATARHFFGSPERMVMIAIFISIISVTGGMFLSVFYDTPASPSIVLCSSFLFLLSYIKKYVY